MEELQALEELYKMTDVKYVIKKFKNWIKVDGIIYTNEEAIEIAKTKGYKHLVETESPGENYIAWYEDMGDYILQNWELQEIEEIH